MRLLVQLMLLSSALSGMDAQAAHYGFTRTEAPTAQDYPMPTAGLVHRYWSASARPERVNAPAGPNPLI